MREYIRSIKRKVALIKTLGLFPKKDGKIILIGSPLHGNLGDHAITLAEKAFFNDYFPKKMFCDISGDDFRNEQNWIKKLVSSADTIVITGGGFMGSLWKREEILIRNIICAFSDNKIIIMPQTLYYEENDDGNRELEESKRIYRSHKNLIMYFRDSLSYEFAKKNFGFVKKISLVPDIVTYLAPQINQGERNSIGICLRKDKERIVSRDVSSIVKEWAKMYKMQVHSITTIEDHLVFEDDREKEVNKKLIEFSSYKIIVTDRLHGMLFAAITATPCIALNNKSGKVKGVYEWLKELNYIRFCEECSSIPQLLSELINLEGQYNVEKFRAKFEIIAKDII